MFYINLPYLLPITNGFPVPPDGVLGWALWAPPITVDVREDPPLCPVE